MEYLPHSSQSIHALDCFQFLFGHFAPDRIVELGTGTGHFTCWLARTLPRTMIYTFDNEVRLRWDPALATPPNVCRNVASIWDEQAAIASLIGEPGVRTLLLCDNGDKIREFRTFAPYVREGNVVMVHDYWPTRADFAKEAKGRLWNSCEIADADVAETLVNCGFVPFHSHRLRAAIWGCWIRRLTREWTLDTCPHRTEVRGQLDEESACCELLRELIGTSHDHPCRVSREQCQACCESFPPSAARLNPTLASLLYERANGEATAALPGLQRARLRELAEKQLGIEAISDPCECFSVFAGKSLHELLPPPRRRCGTVRHWSVGVTTSPRSTPTLERCLEHLTTAGWQRPYLFVDAPVRIPPKFAGLPRTVRDEAVGAWPNYYLALAEMYLRDPAADAFLILQDDAIVIPDARTRQYLESVLWPETNRSIVSLYCATPDTRPQFGWTRRHGWAYGSLAFIFPPGVVRELLTSRPVLDHRLDEEGRGRTGIPELINAWAEQHQIDFHYPTPSLVQHVGHASTLWSAIGPDSPERRAQIQI